MVWVLVRMEREMYTPRAFQGSGVGGFRWGMSQMVLTFERQKILVPFKQQAR